MLFEVNLVGGMPWGFRIQGGIDVNEPLRISRVNSAGKAAQTGLQEGDIIEFINGQSASKFRNSEAHQLIRNTIDRITLTVRRLKSKPDKPTTKMYRSSASIEVNNSATEFSVEHRESPHSTTIKLNPIRAGSKPGREKSRDVISDDLNGVAADKKTTNEEIVNSSSHSKKLESAMVSSSDQDGIPEIQLPCASTVPITSLASSTPLECNEEPAAVFRTRNTSSCTKTEAAVWTPGATSSSEAAVSQQAVNATEPEVAPIWKPFQHSISQEKLQFRRVKIDPASLSQPISQPSVQENGVSYPPPPSFASSSPPEETPSSVTEIQPPPLVPINSLPVKSRPESESHLGDAAVPSLESIPPSFTRINPLGDRLPTYQNPTITLLQKAREGQIPKGAVYIDHKMNSKEEEQPFVRPSPSEKWWEPQFAVKSEEVFGDRKVIQLEPVKFDGIGPVVKGVPISLCTEVKDENKADWYKRMYKSLHKTHNPNGRLPYNSKGGYMSEPEPERDDDYYYRKYATLDWRRPRDDYYESEFRNGSSSKKPSVWNPPSARYRSDIYRNQPKKIEDYEPGRSSLAEMEAKLHGNRDNYSFGRSSHPYMLKDGYESDSTLVYHKRGSPNALSPSEQRAWYKEFQRGGDIPVSGFRRCAPEKPSESDHLSTFAAASLELDKVEFGFPLPPPKVPLIDPEPSHRYQASEVNIHYRTPVQNLEKEYVNEDEIKKRQEQVMKQFYEEERRKKALQEIVDIENRRHNDNFTPSQKSPIPLNRYDNLFEERPQSPQRARTPEPKTAAKALYNFAAQNSKELSFKKGDIIFIHRKIDKNWYEGERHGLIGLLPVNHVEIIPYDGIKYTAKKPSEGQARAKFNFQAQTPMELSLVKGEHVILTRKVDLNWYEGRIGPLKGIFPASYVDVLSEPLHDMYGSKHSPVSKPVASPVSHSLIMNDSSLSPRYDTSSYSRYNNQHVTTYSNPYATVRRIAPARPPVPMFEDKKHPLNQTLHIHTQSDPIHRYRALYAYKPQNDDELELHEGDVVYVLEKCDDGWYVGTSHRTGLFGTFPGNYVERI